MRDALSLATEQLSIGLAKKLDKGFTEELIRLFDEGILQWEVHRDCGVERVGTDTKLNASVQYRIKYCGQEVIERQKKRIKQLQRMIPFNRETGGHD